MNYAEAQDIDESTNRISNIVLETDSLTIRNIIEDIQHIAIEANIYIKHIFKETNQLANYTTNIFFDQRDILQ
ncbi:hypothetical protein H5410_004998 [Solanum commersonii]|uniref:Uncharacterized protein n=1 Tax=Solanum commersonii TaxID=4109 RepID=A0A9J6A6E6_SOLCO|nr:hypothetical protein H5410_004998 [Solanum commersonii]